MPTETLYIPEKGTRRLLTDQQLDATLLGQQIQNLLVAAGWTLQTLVKANTWITWPFDFPYLDPQSDPPLGYEPVAADPNGWMALHGYTVWIDTTRFILYDPRWTAPPAVTQPDAIWIPIQLTSVETGGLLIGYISATTSWDASLSYGAPRYAHVQTGTNSSSGNEIPGDDRVYAYINLVAKQEGWDNNDKRVWGDYAGRWCVSESPAWVDNARGGGALLTSEDGTFTLLLIEERAHPYAYAYATAKNDMHFVRMDWSFGGGPPVRIYLQSGWWLNGILPWGDPHLQYKPPAWEMYANSKQFIMFRYGMEATNYPPSNGFMASDPPNGVPFLQTGMDIYAVRGPLKDYYCYIGSSHASSMIGNNDYSGFNSTLGAWTPCRVPVYCSRGSRGKVPIVGLDGQPLMETAYFAWSTDFSPTSQGDLLGGPLWDTFILTTAEFPLTAVIQVGDSLAYQIARPTRIVEGAQQWVSVWIIAE